MKLVRLFALFVVISFIIGVGSAYNGQGLSTNQLNDAEENLVDDIKDLKEQVIESSLDSSFDLKSENIVTDKEESKINSTLMAWICMENLR